MKKTALALGILLLPSLSMARGGFFDSHVLERSSISTFIGERLSEMEEFDLLRMSSENPDNSPFVEAMEATEFVDTIDEAVEEASEAEMKTEVEKDTTKQLEQNPRDYVENYYGPSYRVYSTRRKRYDAEEYLEPSERYNLGETIDYLRDRQSRAKEKALRLRWY